MPARRARTEERRAPVSVTAAITTLFTAGLVSFGSRFTGSLVRFDGAEFLGAEVNFARADFSGGTVDLSVQLTGRARRISARRHRLRVWCGCQEP